MKRKITALRLKRYHLLKAMGYRYVSEDTATSLSSFVSRKQLFSGNEDFETLRKQVSSCHLCPLSKVRRRVVIPKTSTHIRVMFIGYFPGMAEDSSGIPFSGRSGVMLQNMIRNVLKLDPQQCYSTYVIKCKPSASATDYAEYAEICGSYLKYEIKFASADVIVSLGAEPFNYLTRDNKTIEELRGIRHRYENTPLIVTYDLGYLMKNPGKKAEALQDLMSVKRLLG
jgi:DNA polymerase